MLGILATPMLSSGFTMLVDRRGAASPGGALTVYMVDFIKKHKLDQRQVRVAYVISLPTLPPTRIAWGLTHNAIGTFRSRTFYGSRLGRALAEHG